MCIISINMHINSYPLIFKIKVISYYNKNHTVAETIDVFGISKSSLFNWQKLYDNNNLTNKKRYNKINIKLKPHIKCYIRKYVLTRVVFKYRLLIKNIKKNFKINISKSSIYMTIKKINITYKKINKKKVTKNHKRLKKLKIKFKKLIKKIKIDDIISIDEASFDTNISFDKGWGIKGKKITRNINAERKRYTCICAISNKKIITSDVIKQSANAVTFLDFIKKVTNKVNNKILLMDNARIHHSKIVKNFINNDTNNKILFNLPYNPETNPLRVIKIKNFYLPIEMFYSKIKFLVKCKNNNQNNLKKT